MVRVINDGGDRRGKREVMVEVALVGIEEGGRERWSMHVRRINQHDERVPN